MMNKIKLYIASSLDGFIARPDGALDWLYAIERPLLDYGYGAFLSTIGTTIMGRKTYEEVIGFGIEWPYKGLANYVVSNRTDFQIKSPDTKLLVGLEKDVIRTLMQNTEKDCWLIGGGKLITEFLRMDLIDEMIICIVPTIIGEGIPLFPDKPKESTWKLVGNESFETGVVCLNYAKKQ